MQADLWARGPDGKLVQVQCNAAGELIVGGIEVATVTVTDAATETKQDTIIAALGTLATKLDTLIAQGTTTTTTTTPAP